MSERARSGMADPKDPGEASDRLAAIWPLLGRHIAFHRRLVDLTDSVKGALLLSQAIYWTRHGRDIERSDGWFTKTVQQWEMETGLGEREQGGVRDTLRDRQLLLEQRRGLPARLHFRLCTDRLVEALAMRVGGVCASADDANHALLGQLLGPALAYHRTLARVTRGVHAGLLLSRALHLTRQGRPGVRNGWIDRSSRQWTEDLGLTRREQATARRVLTSLGVWEEALVGVPPRIVARIRTDVLLGILSGTGGQTTQGALDGEDLALGAAQNVGTVVREWRHTDPTKAPRQIRQKRNDRSDETATLLIHRSTSELVQLHHPGAEKESACGERGGELVYPNSFQPEEQEAARMLLDRVGPQAQAILDELAGRLQANAVRASPIAYLRGLVMRATVGTFVPEAGIPIAAARRRRQEEALTHQTQSQAEQSQAAERASPEFQSKVAERREQMRLWLAQSRSSRLNGWRP